MKLNDPKLKNNILSLIMVAAVLLLIGTAIEGFSRMQTENSYKELAAQRNELKPLSQTGPLQNAPPELPKPGTPGAGLRPEASSAPATAPFDLQENPNAPWLAINPDYAGWITVQGTTIDYPYVRGNDNQEYLKKDFYGKSSKAGTVFMDYRNLGGVLDKHLILYGHNMKNGSMFHDLVKFQDKEFLKNNPSILISDLYTTRTYQIISVYEISADDYTLPTEFTDSAAYSAFLDDLVSRSMYPIPVELDKGDDLLTLITCSYGVDNGRTIVHAIELNK